jgi:hypothetical protein
MTKIEEIINLYNSGLSVAEIARKLKTHHTGICQSLIKHYPNYRKKKCLINPSVIDLKIKIDSLCTPEPNTGCWLWIGSINKFGYGMVGYNRIQNYAHRLSYEVYKGSIPEGLLIRHSCDQPSCVNPDHLELGTDMDNNKDMVNRGREWYQKTVSNFRVGESVSNSKYTESQIVNVYKLLKQGVPVCEISKTLNIPRNHISNIKSGKCWNHITGIAKRNKKM